MLSRTKLFEYWICLSSEPWLDPPHTVEVADKLAVSLVEFSYSVLYNTSKLQVEKSATSISLDIKRRSIDLRVEISSLEIEFIDDIAKNCCKIERLLASEHEYNQNNFAPVFDLPLPCLRRLVIIPSRQK